MAEISEAERTVLDLLGRGYSERRVARELGVSLSTVRRRLRSARDALGAKTRFHLGVVAARHGFISEPYHGTVLTDDGE